MRLSNKAAAILGRQMAQNGAETTINNQERNRHESKQNQLFSLIAPHTQTKEPRK